LPTDYGAGSQAPTALNASVNVAGSWHCSRKYLSWWREDVTLYLQNSQEQSTLLVRCSPCRISTLNSSVFEPPLSRGFACVGSYRTATLSP